MADNNKENWMSINDFDFAHEDAIDDTPMLVNYLVTWLQQAMGNPARQGKVQQQLHAYGILLPPQQKRDPEKSHGETSKRGLSTAREVENSYHEIKNLLEGKPSSKKKGYVQHEGSPSKEREGSESQDKSMEDVAPRKRGLHIVLTAVNKNEKRRAQGRRRREKGHHLLHLHHPLPLMMKIVGILLKKSKGEKTEGHMQFRRARKGYSLRSGYVYQSLSEEAQSRTPKHPQVHVGPEEEGGGTSSLHVDDARDGEQQTTAMFLPTAPANVSTTSDMHDTPNTATVVHKRLLGEPIDLGLLGDFFTRFFVKRNTSPPLIPLCRLLPNEAIRTVSSQVEMFCDSFDIHGYVDASAPFLVSFTRPGSSIHFEVTQLDLHEWGPNWVQEHEKFEDEIRGTEWEDLKDKKFLVWDGNHHVKAWILRTSFENAVKLAKTSIDRHSRGLEEYAAKCEKARGVVEQTFRDRAYKMLTIANPSNGNSFFQLIFNYDWSKKGMVAFTKEKLDILATSRIHTERETEVLHMLMSGKVKDEATIDMFGDNKKTLLHMQKELYWEELMEEGESIIEGLAMYDDVPTNGFGKWVKNQREMHVRWAFHVVWKDLAKVKEGEKQHGIEEASKRVVYRWLVKTFSDEGDAIVDIFAGCGGLGRAVQEFKKNNLGIENDAELARACLADFA
ncbi:hypothetical protein L7F22_066642 [Adiantum nelumboides]|nr:hypothetical protein [Adiantum nelumboides]